MNHCSGPSDNYLKYVKFSHNHNYNHMNKSSEVKWKLAITSQLSTLLSTHELSSAALNGCG